MWDRSLMKTVVALLYVIGFVLVLVGAVGAWLQARRKYRDLDATASNLRRNHDRYEAASATLLVDRFEVGLGDTPDAAERVARAESQRAMIEAENAQLLDAAGIVPAGSPSRDMWIPIELQMELTLLNGTLRSLRWAGLVALLGGLLSMTASVWSLYL